MTDNPIVDSDALERVFHERRRLAILTALLSRGGSASFTDLREHCGLTDGNLNSHLAALEAETIVTILREIPRRGRPQTVVHLTPEGRKRFMQYLDHLQNIVEDALTLSKQLRPNALRPAGG